MDIWEANSLSNALTPHTCSGIGSFLCAGDACGRTGVCDKSGCGFNAYGSGAKDFYGPGLTVDTSRPFTVVTQFFTSDNTTAGALKEIRRLYIQDGKLIQNAAIQATANSATGVASITQDFCTARNASDFNRLGGVQGMGASLARGMVLIFSLWNSNGDFMNWLDSGNAGPCNATAGNPALIIQQNPEVEVTFSNIRWGDIGATFNAANLTVMSVPGVAHTETTSESFRAGLPVFVSVSLAVVMGYLLS
jgi:cellulase